MPLHIHSRERRQHARSLFRTRVLVANLDQIRLLQRLHIEAARQFADRMFDLLGPLRIRGVSGNQFRHGHNFFQQILVAQQFDFGIQLFLGNVRSGEIHGARGWDETTGS